VRTRPLLAGIGSGRLSRFEPAKSAGLNWQTQSRFVSGFGDVERFRSTTETAVHQSLFDLMRAQRIDTPGVRLAAIRDRGFRPITIKTAMAYKKRDKIRFRRTHRPASARPGA
jgi:hypothetical protein